LQKRGWNSSCEGELVEKKVRKPKYFVGTKGTIIIAVIAAFLLSYYFVASQRAGEYSVDGMKIISSENPRQALAKILSKNNFLIEEHLFKGMDERNTAVAIIGAEIAAVLNAHNKTVNAYGIVEGVPAVNCNANTSNCTGANIIIGVSECNCVRIGEKIEVYGTAQFLRENAAKIRGVLKLVLSYVAPTPPPTMTPAQPPQPVNATPPVVEPQCTADENCSIGGPYGIVCGPTVIVENLSTGGEWRREYECFEREANLTSCKCIQGTCKWERTPEFCECGEKYNKSFKGC